MAMKTPRARKSKKGSGPDKWLVAGIILGLLVIALALWGPFRKSPHDGQLRQIPDKKQHHPAKKPDFKRPQAAPAKPAGKYAEIAIIIDDLGQDIRSGRDVMSLPGGITIAVMPGLPHSREIAALAGKKSIEVLLHLPMERKSNNGKPLAPGILRSDMTPMEFVTTIREDIDSVPGAVGVNNHEGSSLTENKEAMKFLMAELKNREVFFLDSLTNPKSIAYTTAREFGIKSAKRDIFIDNEENNQAYVQGQLEKLSRIAKKHGKAIGIGHPHPVTISALKKWLSEIKEQGIEIVPVSRLVE